jgi:hypothetical protein
LEIIESTIIVVITLVVSQYIFGPILIWCLQKMPESYRFNILNAEEFLEERSDIFLNLHNEIKNNGFNYIGSSELKMSHSSMCFSIYYNTDSKLCCTLSSAYSQPSNTTQIEFTQLFEDGSVININKPLQKNLWVNFGSGSCPIV